MMYLFCALICGFSIISAKYLLDNNFSIETVEIIFPAVGAVLFSLYLGFKFVVVDAPPPSEHTMPVAMLVNWKIGSYTSMVKRILEDRFEKMDRFKGLHAIEMLGLYDKFKELNFNKKLIASSTNDLGSVTEAQLDLIEYGIWIWLADFEQLYIAKEGIRVYGVSAMGGTAYVVTEDLSKIPAQNVVNIGKSQNSILEKMPVQIRLPEKSFVTRETLSTHRKLTLTTPHSKIEIFLYPSVGGVFSTGIDKVSRKISQLFNIPTTQDCFWHNTFVVKIRGSQRVWSRLSKQAKIEKNWQARIMRKIDEDFSWHRLRDAYASD